MAVFLSWRIIRSTYLLRHPGAADRDLRCLFLSGTLKRGLLASSDWIADPQIVVGSAEETCQPAFKPSVSCLLNSEVITETKRMLRMSNRETEVGIL